MSILVHDCPHCGTRQAAFPINFSEQQPTDQNYFNVFASCPACAFPLAAVVFNRGTGRDPKAVAGNLAAPHRNDVSVQHIFPTRTASKSPDSVPEAAAKAFVEGAESLKDGRYTAAVAMFRRTIDVGTKQFSADVDVWRLEKRIDKLAAEGLITKDLQEWAHKIRLEGNEAIHELDEPTKEQAVELQLFTELMLTYLYTLPAKVKANIPDQTEAPVG